MIINKKTAETQITNPKSFPLKFELVYDEGQFATNGLRGCFALQVRIEHDCNLSYITDTNFSVVDASQTKFVDHISVHVIKV